MDTISNIFHALTVAIMAVLMQFTGAPDVTPPAPAIVAELATSTDVTVHDTISGTAQRQDVDAAYRLGKAVGRLEATSELKAQQVTNPTTTPMTNSTGGTSTPPISGSSSTGGGATSNEPTNGSNTPAPEPAPVVESKARIELISPLAGKGLGRTYKAAPEVVDESNYISFSAIVYNEAGDAVDNAVMTVKIDEGGQSEEKSINGTGAVANIFVNGQKKTVPAYSINHDFHTAGTTVITISANGMVQVVQLAVQ